MKKFLLFILLTFTCACTTFSDKETLGTFPIYGNYCGPDHPLVGTTPTPIDTVDLSCKYHDQCYSTNGYLSLSCDEKLLSDLQKIEPKTLQEKAAKQLIIAYFKRSPKIQ